jgi:aminopeptidase N
MWFGDGVGYAEWRDVWLSEGFASYFGPWLQAQTGGPSLRDSLLRMRAIWAGSPEGRTQSIRDGRFTDPVEVLNANTYPKAAWVLHMLRGELGDERFFAALRAWYRGAAGRAATSQEFVAAVEKSSGEDLGWFFAQWLERAGCPELRAARDADAIAIEQVQEGDPYRCWLRLRWRDGKGEPQEQRVRLDGKGTRVPAAGEVRDLQLDPDDELLFRPAK